MNNKTYDVLKYIALVVLPALGTLYFALAEIWGLPYGAEIVGTLTAIDAFLGAILRLSTLQYEKKIEDEAERSLETIKKEIEEEESGKC